MSREVERPSNVFEEARYPATYADLESLPEHRVGEIIAGALYVSPRPPTPQTIAVRNLLCELGHAFWRPEGSRGDWIILREPELHLGGDVFVPNLVGWHRERLSLEQLKAAAQTLVPDWVCEALCPATESFDRCVKLDAYAREGIPHVWLVDPDVRTLEVFRLDGPHYLLTGAHASDATVHAEPFEALALQLRVLWVP